MTQAAHGRGGRRTFKLHAAPEGKPGQPLCGAFMLHPPSSTVSPDLWRIVDCKRCLTKMAQNDRPPAGV